VDGVRNHPSIEGVKSLKAAQKYIEKEGDFVSNIETLLKDEKPKS